MIADLSPQYIKTRQSKALTKLIGYTIFTGRPLTTKGQWINPYLLSLFKFLTKLPQQKKIIKPIFIIGMGRSGTTILGSVLSIHKEIGFLKEPKILWHYIYPKQDIIGSHSVGEVNYSLDENHVDKYVKLKANRLYGTFLATTFSKRILDKYPEMIFRIPFVKEIFPEAKFILIIRNGWDVVHSIVKWSEKYGIIKNGHKHDWWGFDDRKWNLLVEQLVKDIPSLNDNIKEIKSFERHTDRAATEWVVTMQKALQLQQNNRNDIHFIKFEDLTNNPKESLQNIITFCELPTDKIFLDYACNTLYPLQAKSPINLDKNIETIFIDTMNHLGYNE